MEVNVKISVNLVPFGSFHTQETLRVPEPTPPPKEEVIPLYAPPVTGLGREIILAPDFVSPPGILIR